MITADKKEATKMPRCGECGTELIEEVDGFPLGFLACPKCKCAPETMLPPIETEEPKAA